MKTARNTLVFNALPPRIGDPLSETNSLGRFGAPDRLMSTISNTKSNPHHPHLMRTKPKPTKRADGTLNALCAALKLSKRRVSTLLAQGMPDGVEAALAWRAARESDGSVEELRRQRIALVIEQREKARIENQVRRDELISRAEVFASSLGVAHEIRRAFLGLLGTLPTELIGLPTEVAIYKILREKFHSCLEALSNGKFSNTPEIRETVDSLKTANPNDR